MNDYVADTHSLFWYLIGSPKLGAKAKAVFDEAQAGEAFIHISVIVLAELYYLNEKHSSPIEFGAEFEKLKAGSQFVVTPLEADDVVDFEQDKTISEMHDSIIVGLARRLKCSIANH